MIHPLVAELLIKRGIFSEEAVQRFLYGTLADLPNPFLLPEMDRAVDRLLQALGKKERILFFGDYDVDGITGTAALTGFFREMGLKTEGLLPHRLKDGYGLSETSVKKISALRPELLVTIDNGTSARAEIGFLRKQGIDVIVIDHHETPSEKGRPEVSALLNPKSSGSRFPEREIASAGLVFLLLMALRSKCRDRGITPLPNLKRYLDLACLGTIADIVPLIGTNRLLVKYGLEEIGKSSRPGLKALLEKADVRPPVTVGSVAFRIAPRINAAGRLADPRIALDLLLAENLSDALNLASRLEELNQERQRTEEKVVREAVALVEREQTGRRGIVAAGRDWHLGVVGIVAAKLVDRFGRPSVVLSLSEDGKEAKGSARTVAGFSVYRALKKIEGEMTRFGGHDAACGLAVAGENLDRFAQKFDASVKEEWPKEWDETGGPPRVAIDAEISLDAINTALVKELQLLEPHGPGNPEPVLMTGGVLLEGSRVVGKGHLKTVLCQGGSRIEAIGFNLGAFVESSTPQSPLNIAFTPQFNSWNGIENLQLKIKSIYN